MCRSSLGSIINNYSSICALRLAIGPSCRGIVCSAVYRNRGCHFSNISFVRSIVCRDGCAAALNYSSVVGLRLGMGPVRGIALDRSVYRNSICRFNSALVSRSNRCIGAFISSRNYSSAIALVLAMVSPAMRLSLVRVSRPAERDPA